MVKLTTKTMLHSSVEKNIEKPLKSKNFYKNSYVDGFRRSMGWIS